MNERNDYKSRKEYATAQQFDTYKCVKCNREQPTKRNAEWAFCPLCDR